MPRSVASISASTSSRSSLDSVFKLTIKKRKGSIWSEPETPLELYARVAVAVCSFISTLESGIAAFSGYSWNTTENAIAFGLSLPVLLLSVAFLVAPYPKLKIFIRGLTFLGGACSLAAGIVIAAMSYNLSGSASAACTGVSMMFNFFSGILLIGLAITNLARLDVHIKWARAENPASPVSPAYEQIQQIGGDEHTRLIVDRKLAGLLDVDGDQSNRNSVDFRPSMDTLNDEHSTLLP